MYFVITNSDGDTYINQYSKEELEKALIDEDELGDCKPRSNIEESDSNYWGENGILIIKGEIVIPTSKKVVTKLEMP